MEKPQSPSPRPQPPESKAATESSLAPQLARLYGETLFGPWQDPLESIEASRGAHKRGRWRPKLAVLLVAAVVAAAGAWVYRHGLSRRAEQNRAQVAKDVATFLADGELDRLAQYLSILQPPTEPLDARSPHLDLVVAAEAALYRYQDGAAERLARIAPHVSANAGTPERRLAGMTVSSQPERIQAWETLARSGGSLDKNPEYHTVMATVLEQRGDLKAARVAWERSAQVGPLWLPHRYLQCAFEARQNNLPAVTRIAQHMIRVAPASAWTGMTLRHFAKAMTVPPGTSTPEPPSTVAQYYDELTQALSRLSSRDLASARPALGRALAAVHGQSPFVLDAFTMLVSAKAKDLAMEMTSYEMWPRGNRWAQDKATELATAATAAATTTTASATATNDPSKQSEGRKTKAKKAKEKKKGKAKKRRGRGRG